MESDEKYLERKFGRQNHFAVPEGYLQNLTASVMANVGKQPECDASENETALTENVTPNARDLLMQPGWRYGFLYLFGASCRACFQYGSVSSEP